MITIDPQSGDVLATLPVASGPLLGIGASYLRRLFIVPRDDTADIVEIDPWTGTELRRFPEPDQQRYSFWTGLSFDGQRLFYFSQVNNGIGDPIYQLDPETGAVVDSIITSFGGSGDFNGLAIAGDELFILDEDDNQIHILQDGVHVSVFSMNDDTVGGLAWIDYPPALITTNTERLVQEVDPWGGVLRTFDPQRDLLYAGAAVVGGEIYLSSVDDPAKAIYVHDRSGNLLRTISMPYAVTALGGDDSAARGLGVVVPIPDVDQYSLDLTGHAGRQLDLLLRGQAGIDFADQQLQLLAADGTTVLATATAQGPGNADLGITGFTVPADAVYFVKVVSSIAGAYALTVTVPPLDLPVTVVSVGFNLGLPDPADLPSGQQPTSWQQQRSDVRTLVVQFSEPVDTVRASDIELINLGIHPGQPDRSVDLSSGQWSHQQDVLTITLQSPLDDGVYLVRILPSVVGVDGLPLDGDGDGAGGDAYQLTGNPENQLFQFHVDWNGDGGVSIFDFAPLVYWFGQSIPGAPEYMDINEDGGVTIFDFWGLASRWQQSLVFPTGDLATAIAMPSGVDDVHRDGDDWHRIAGVRWLSEAVGDHVLRFVSQSTNLTAKRVIVVPLPRAEDQGRQILAWQQSRPGELCQWVMNDRSRPRPSVDLRPVRDGDGFGEPSYGDGRVGLDDVLDAIADDVAWAIQAHRAS